MTETNEPLFEVDQVYRPEGRGHILVGHLIGDATIRAGDQLGFKTDDGLFMILTVDGLDLTPKAAEGGYSLVVSGLQVERIRPGSQLTRLEREC
jgi:hypothetical protein